jgi:EAL domain-containing protein (putative c-di-GMP-specific phosphodiesterase class I)/GGDEF domain-containing protein
VGAHAPVEQPPEPRGAHFDLIDALSAAARHPDASVGLLLVNVLDIPMLHARLGFVAGERLLHQLGESIARAFAPRGRLVRLGDGSFGVALTSIRNRGHATLAGEKLLRVADDVFSVAELVIKPQLCIGIAMYPQQTTDVTRLVHLGQLAAAAASRQSVRLQVYEDAAAAQVVGGWDLSEEFAKALEAGDLAVHYQPKISTATGASAGVEALLRWLRDGRPVSTPDVFLPLAEQAGLGNNITWYVLSNALRVAAEHRGLSVAVNISPQMLHHREFLGMVEAAIAAWGSGDSVLTLEITEGALMLDFEEASRRLTQVRNAGVRVSIDDFGTGYSSLNYFKRIPADELKIDKSFVMRMLDDASDHRLVDTILKLAKQFNLQTVAEGVEDRATYEALVAMGCDYAQGFYFSPALDAGSLGRWLDRERPAAAAMPGGLK